MDIRWTNSYNVYILDSSQITYVLKKKNEKKNILICFMKADVTIR